MTIWGNHSTTQYPDLFHAEVDGKNAYELGRRPRLGRRHVHPDRRQARARRSSRPAARRRRRRRPTPRSTTCARGRSARPTATGCRWRSRRDGSYGVPEGIISSFPCTCKDGEYSIVQGLDIDDYSRGKIDASVGRARRGARRRQGARPDLRPLERVSVATVGDGDTRRRAHHRVDAALQLLVADPLDSRVAVDEVADRHHRQRLDAADRGERVEHRRLHLDAEVAAVAASGAIDRRVGVVEDGARHDRADVHRRALLAAERDGRARPAPRRRRRVRLAAGVGARPSGRRASPRWRPPCRPCCMPSAEPAARADADEPRGAELDQLLVARSPRSGSPCPIDCTLIGAPSNVPV